MKKKLKKRLSRSFEFIDEFIMIKSQRKSAISIYFLLHNKF